MRGNKKIRLVIRYDRHITIRASTLSCPSQFIPFSTKRPFAFGIMILSRSVFLHSILIFSYSHGTVSWFISTLISHIHSTSREYSNHKLINVFLFILSLSLPFVSVALFVILPSLPFPSLWDKSCIRGLFFICLCLCLRLYLFSFSPEARKHE